jgi:FkbM family methyltransferase
MTEREAPPFGAMRPSAFNERIRALARRLPRNYLGRKLASLLLGLAGGRAKRAYDVEIFGVQRARLHPFDNICEKRVYLTPQLWDPEERALLAGRVAAHAGEEFIFADVGANVGLYTLFARAEAQRAGKAFRGFCVEADPEMRARLAFNIEASGAQDEVEILPYAATATEGPVRFSVNRQSRGMSRIAEAGEIEVEGRTLARTLAEAPRIDAMKIDIEGHEFAVLDAFFWTASQALWPAAIIMEISHEDPAAPVRALVESKGYRCALETGLNAVFVRDGA